ncbi:MAG: YkgJ family cysteine cluster protein [Deltaproteobacteria bacterium]|nr:YkgJ family cysteine cluster protein [Deltaproteobacteria bacterium]
MGVEWNPCEGSSWGGNSIKEKVLKALTLLYLQADRQVARLQAVHSARLQCRLGCTRCCVDGLTVFEVEAGNIRRHHKELLLKGRPHPEGACAFLDESGACRIYERRPYVCRTQGLPLRWIEIQPDGSRVEMRDICPLNEGGPSVETLPAEACWTIGPFEDMLAGLQIALSAKDLGRTPLRTLFRGT